MDIDQQARHAAARVDASKVSFDPITIITIFSTVMPLLMQCFNRNDEPSPSEARASLQRYHDAQPEKLQKRTARRIRAEADEPMTREASYLLAEAVIAQALSVDDATASACCHEAGVDL